MIKWKLINIDELTPKTEYLISTGTEVMVARFRGKDFGESKWETTEDELTINEPYFPIKYYAEINLPDAITSI
jgi:hypothetical protein